VSSETTVNADIHRAAAAVAAADAILIGAGAGMGVDSGLPDFRGNQGFWRAYPAFRGRRFAEMSNPLWFRNDPALAWGFFGHRLNLYRQTEPHEGFEILRRWCEQRPDGGFVFTSNVDGHFQRAGFDEARVLECHGSIHFLQCAAVCSREIRSAGELQVEVDAHTMRCTSPLPRCENCRAVSRPNILMFGDFDWLPDRCERQHARYRWWREPIESRRLAVVELGAGVAVPTVRHECESRGGQLIRINPRDHQVPAGAISIPLRALEALERIDACL